MKIESVFDPGFRQYGQVLDGYELAPLLDVLERETPCPDGVEYVAELPALMALELRGALQARAFGGMPVQLGYCNGHNTRLNCLEYHRDSEFNAGSRDFVLLLARRDEMEGGRLDTSKVRAFRCPAGTLIEVYATTLHYAPCSAVAGEGFKVLIGLPRGTNLDRPEITAGNDEDRLLWARNKWLLAHAESAEAAAGAPVRLDGPNIDLA